MNIQNIERFGTTARYSDVVAHGNTVYLVEVAHDLEADAAAQTREILASIERSLALAGSDKTRLLQVTIYLADMADYDAMNAVFRGRFGHQPHCLLHAPRRIERDRPRLHHRHVTQPDEEQVVAAGEQDLHVRPAQPAHLLIGRERRVVIVDVDVIVVPGVEVDGDVRRRPHLDL